jgi:hypothetical protein
MSKPNSIAALRFDEIPIANAIAAVFESTPMPGVPGEKRQEVWASVSVDLRTDHPQHFEAWKDLMRAVFKSEIASRSNVPEDEVKLQKGKFGNQN